MNDIKALLELDWIAIILGIFIAMSSIIAIYTIICKFSEIIKKPIGVAKQRKQDHELLLQTVQDLKELHNTHKEDTKQSIRHDEMIRKDLQALTSIVDDIASKLEVMEAKIDATEMAKLKEKILGYYRKYSPIGEWEKFESDVFWELYNRYISHGGNTFVVHNIEPVMRRLKIKD